MKKILFAFIMLLAIAACTNKPVTAIENNRVSSEVAFEVAKNYFFKNDQVIPEYPKITTEEEFYKLFGSAYMPNLSSPLYRYSPFLSCLCL